MPQNRQATPANLAAMKLIDFGQLQSRYQSLTLEKRAASVIEDAQLALETAERLLATLSVHPDLSQAFGNLSKNIMLTSRMRPSEAKTLLMESGGDFTGATRRKLAAWHKTMQRIAQGEDIVKDGAGRDYIPAHTPLALAIAGSCGVSNYFSILQLVLAELTKLDPKNAIQHTSAIAEFRRCATVLADCEHASGIQAMVH